MPAKSKAQQRLFGMALALRKGEMEPEDACKKVREIADSDITTKDIKKFAQTKCKKLPKHVTKECTKYSVTEEQLCEIVQNGLKNFLIREGFMDDDYDDSDEAIQERVNEFVNEFEPVPVKFEGSAEEDGFTVTLKDKNKDFYICFDVWIRNDDVTGDWNQYIFNTYGEDKFRSALQDNTEMFEKCINESVYYLESNGKIYQDDNSNWHYSESKKDE